jgi:hypothetical protein
MLEYKVIDELTLTMLPLETNTAAATTTTTTSTTSVPFSPTHVSSCFYKWCSFHGSVTTRYILCKGNFLSNCKELYHRNNTVLYGLKKLTLQKYRSSLVLSIVHYIYVRYNFFYVGGVSWSW